jgi:IS5 family transposase
MRTAIDQQMKFGETSIYDIKFDAHCRDELPQLLMGLQSLYCNEKVRLRIFDILKELIPENISLATGRKGMNLWRIFVLGCVRLCCNMDFDKLHDMANCHRQLRQMLGHSIWDLEKRYALSTLKDNLSLFTPEVLGKISQIVVEHGHEVYNKKIDEILRGSCDSFALETDVHYPTDISVLWDAVRRIITLTMMLCKDFNISDWRQGKINLQKVKACFRHAQQAKRSTSKKEEVKKEKEQLVIIAHTLYINLAQGFIDKARQTLKTLPSSDIVVHFKVLQIEEYCNDAEILIDQIKRRVVNGETIPQDEKIFSIFERHTEWISKGKAGVPVELGVKVCIVKDQYGFLLHHRVMENETDDKIAVSIVEETRKRFPDFKSCSFDKGFHSKPNQEELSKILDHVILPRKGKLSVASKEIEDEEIFKEARKKHSAVESSINALENHGLDRCPDHGIEGFKRYTALAVVARNIQIVGAKLQQKELKKLQRKSKKLKLAA